MPDYENCSPEDIRYEAVYNTLKLAKVLGGERFEDITQDEVNDLIDAHSETRTDEDLLELMRYASEDEKEVPVPEK
ncbi:Hypothetical predicted protein [Octopus vulgaris]|uniref:Uncharacterized protein n=1 Tax=Octopus vulgaris TaxID=6645 RepID=A0AA36B271_OCTVU|nr:Hypothetical predicted protein [Octopus vulgaris]